MEVLQFVITVSGRRICLKLSDESCKKKSGGFKPEDKIINPHTQEVAEVLGIAPSGPGEPDVVWLAYEEDGKRARYWGMPGTNLWEAGFRLKI